MKCPMVFLTMSAMFLHMYNVLENATTIQYSIADSVIVKCTLNINLSYPL